MCGSEPVMGALENSTSDNHILPSDLVLINVLSVTLEIRLRMLLKRMFKSLVMFCPIPVSLLSRQTLKCVTLKLPSHVNMGVLKKASVKTSLMKILCLELLSVFLRSYQNLMVYLPGRRQMQKKMLIRQMYLFFLLKVKSFMRSLQVKTYKYRWG